MARNVTVKADPNAPGVTEMLARFVAEHPARGWSDAVDRERIQSISSEHR